MNNNAEATVNKDRLMLPILRLGDSGEPVYVKVESPIFKIEAKDNVLLEWMDVTDLLSGKLRSMRVQTVLADVLRTNFPADGYVGNSFEIKKYKPQPGKRYATFSVTGFKATTQTPLQPSAQDADKLSAEPKQQHDKSKLRKPSINADASFFMRYESVRRICVNFFIGGTGWMTPQLT